MMAMLTSAMVAPVIKVYRSVFISIEWSVQEVEKTDL